MNVVVNGRFLGRRVTGVERYGREILSRLGSRTRVVRPVGQAEGIRGHLWEQVKLPGRIAPHHVLWSPANTGPLAVRDQVLTLHDISPLEHPEWYVPAFALWYRLFIPLLVRRARRVVTSSQCLRERLMRRYRLPGERVAVVPGGVDEVLFHPGAGSSFDLPDCYVLVVGSLQARKNLARLLEAWERIKADVPDAWLLIAGTGADVFRPVSLDIPERVGLLGAVPDAELPGLYANATVYILPSLDEGFGLTALEAMACGTAVLASHAGALPEVIGDGGLYFDPLDVNEMAETLRFGLMDTALREALSVKGQIRAGHFSWECSAKMMWNVFEGVR